MNSTRYVAAVLGLLAVSSSPVCGQSLITDIAANPSGGGSAGISSITVAGSQAFFGAFGPWGWELYVTDGTSAGTHMVKDLGSFGPGNPNANSNPRYVTAFGRDVLFGADVEGLGRELWKSDGTAAGTVLVKDLNPGPGFGDPQELVLVGGLVYFTAFDGSGSGLFVTDGTAAGTVPVFRGAARPTELTASGSTLFFSLATPLEGTELWKSDGTLAGTSMVADLVAGGSSAPTKLTPFQGGVLFAATVGGNGQEPYFSDGTAAGTVALGDLWSGPVGSAPQQFTVIGSQAVFVANDDVNAGTELYVTDGTAAGTSQLAVGIAPDLLVAFGSHAYFSANDANGRELWRTDGTISGTGLFVDVAMPGSSTPQEFAVIGNELWFSATDGANGREPWKTDGTVAGTQLVRNVAPSSFSSRPTTMVAFGSDVLCSLTDAGVGIELGVIAGDGSSAGVVQDIDVVLSSSFPEQFVAFPGGAFFTATSPSIGNEGFVTDGTAAGTVPIDVWAVAGAGSTPGDPVAFGGEVYFSAGVGTDRELWKTNGTPFGTVMLSDIANATSTSPSRLGATANGVVFSGSQPGNGFELFVSDGTPAGTGMIFEITPGSGSSNIDNMTSNGAVAVFTAFRPATGSELWVTDGTASGTFEVDLVPGSFGSGPGDIVDADGTFFFAAGSSLGRALFQSDGTLAGTVQAVPNSTLTGVFALTASGARVFGLATAPGIGQELFVSDGTAVGTVSIDVNGGPASSVISSLTGAAGGAFFVYDGAGNGNELWFSNGTQVGTGEVLDIAPGLASGVVPDTIVPILGGAQVAFLANDLSNGLQLWTSDGTAAGTVMATSFGGDGVGVASVGEVFSNGAEVFFAANDGVLGVEPWTLNTGAPFVLTYGNGCAGFGQSAPTIASSGGASTLGNAAFAVDVDNAVPSSLAALFFSPAPANIPLGAGCSALLSLPVLSYGATLTDPAGSGSLAVPLPAGPAALGASIFFQYGVLSPTGPFLGLMDLTDGLHVQIGT